MARTQRGSRHDGRGWKKGRGGKGSGRNERETGERSELGLNSSHITSSC